MMMRYHWGLAIGHIYAHKPPHTGQGNEAVRECEGTAEDSREEYQEVSCVTFDGSRAHHEDMEHSLVTRDNDDLDDTEASESDRDKGQSDIGDDDDEIFTAI
jgi:hypothetical protein